MRTFTVLGLGLALLGTMVAAVERGPWAVEETSFVLQDRERGRRVEVLLLHPRRAEPAPWVLFSPGFLFTGPDYRSWGEVLASHGVPTALLSYAYSLFNPDHRVLAADLQWVLDHLPQEAARRGIPLALHRVALVGHSLGGKLSFLVAAERPVQAVVGLDPVDGGPPGVTDPRRFPSAVALMGAIEAPVLLLGAEYGGRGLFGMPCAPPAGNFRQFFEAAAGPALEVLQYGAGHLDYLDNPQCGFLCSLCWPGEDPVATQAEAQRYTLLFLRGHLLREEAALAALRVLLLRHVQENLVSIREKPGPTP